MSAYLEFSHISKSYPGVLALDDISFKAEKGRVLALMGENGAGKSTLLKILSGDIRPNEGEVLIDGKVMDFHEPHDAIRNGVSVIYQERQLFPELSIMENIFPGQPPTKKGGFVDTRTLRENTLEVIKAFGLPIDPNELVGRLSVAYQQMVEIMKAYQRNLDIIAFDEPTAPLTDTETSILFRIIEKLKAEGKTIIYVSHRMAEIFQVSDDIIVFKDGKLVAQMKTSETNEKELITAMVGRDIGDTYSNLSRNDTLGEVILEVKNLTTYDITDVSFSIKRGEVLGFAGLVGAGRTEVVRAIFGRDKILSGEIIFDGEKVEFKEPKDAIEKGIALCPEDRKEQGLLLHRSVRENITIPVLNKISNGPFLQKDKEADLTRAMIDKFSIKTPSINKVARELSGGNQQKVILGRWTNEQVDTSLLILDEPTKGIDVGTKAEIYQMVCDFAKTGMSVIFISSELTEVINVADRIIVMHNGHITGEVMREDATEENVLALAMLN